ncbi:MAG: carboxylesterase family protein [Atopobiaceae bacterium]|nr:carboxylesterase family protein [Atopobiaceae bacterium]MCH4214188.1 carboxylesterase family protein [Atopobiaceae bacterium]MCH4229467.1 carboxylesterase family protein [Atopobiaceae bacterium]MCH4275854.1 carboxylesterase family protein [Atopobiaceae bacterium]MCI1260611.1 carboxylesterase family protein [Atopobiaceae bacterium]
MKLGAGTLLGFRDEGVYTFRGIPYATAERFQDPVPVTSYDNAWHNALVYGEVAPQDRTLSSTASVNSYEFFSPSNGTADMVGNEQCQYLNVWSDDLTAAKPVIVFFHGGELTNGASTELSFYEGQYLVHARDVVFVSVNTRLNVLGFLDMSAYGTQYENSGIAGMRDAVVALQWVQDNIAQFGGDPQNVTLVGQSGGGCKVTTLASMSDTTGLFDKVVMMSGYYSAAPKDDALANTQLLVDYLHLSSDKVADSLVEMPYEQLLSAATAAGCSWETHYGTGTFESPLVDVKTGAVNQYAAQRIWLIGNTFSEFNGNMSAYCRSSPQTVPNSYLPDVSDDDARSALNELYGDDADEFVTEYQKAYPDHQLAESLWISGCGTIVSRYQAVKPDSGFITLMNKAGLSVYNYVNAYRMPAFGGITMGHTSDVPYMFNSVDAAQYLIRGDEDNARTIAATESSALAAFATTGNPSIDGLAWDPYTSDNHVTMVFDTKSETRTGHDDRLYEIMNAHSQNVTAG